MDTNLITKFPCGGTWWKVQHPAANQWQQAFYEGSHHEDNAPHTPTAKSQGRVEGRAERRTEERAERRAEGRAHGAHGAHGEREKVRTGGLTPLCDYIMNMIDPCASLYTVAQKMDAVQWLKQRLFNFVSSDAHMYLGPKKSRVLSVWLSGNASKPESEGIVHEFVEFLLVNNYNNQKNKDDTTPMVLHLDRRGQWFVKK